MSTTSSVSPSEAEKSTAVSQSTPVVSVGDRVTVEVTRPAHGGAGIGVLDSGLVVMVDRALPGDMVRARITSVKKKFATADIIDVVVSSPMRGPQRCKAASKGAGCCDFGHVAAGDEVGLKARIVADQLSRIGGFTPADLDALGVSIEVKEIGEPVGWRTRMRLGVDSSGQAGVRQAHGTEVIAVPCSQAVEGLFDGVCGPGAQRFTPGVELVVVRDSEGQRHIVEVGKPARGRRVATAGRVVEGSGLVAEKVGDITWHVPAAAFWQAHVSAAEEFAAIVTRYVSEGLRSSAAHYGRRTALAGWDLYGGAGVLAPAVGDGICEALLSAHVSTLPEITVHSVDSASAACESGKKALAGMPVTFHSGDVTGIVPTLPRAAAVVLDPPRTGAGEATVAAIASTRPGCVVHIGCDAATFARDIASWSNHGYKPRRITVINAFPGTSHAETIALLTPASSRV